MTLRIRPFTSADYPVLAAIASEQQNEPTTAESMERNDQRRPASIIFTRLVAEGANGEVIGYALANGGPPMPTGKFHGRVRVAVAHQGTGAGRLLWGALQGWLHEQGAQKLETSVHEKDERAQAIAKREGFNQTHHLFESTLALPTWDPTPWLGTVADAESSGIRFTTMAELGMTDEWCRRLHAVSTRTERDIPNSEGMGEIPYEDWIRFIANNPQFPPEGVHLALDGEQIAALALVTRLPSGALYNGFTGVDRPYRGRGLALALKVEALRWAKSTGAPYVRTNNHSVNGPMLAVNRKLGYIPEPGFFILEKSLA